MSRLRGGFSFCGTDIADIDLEYAPSKDNTYVYRPATERVHEENFEGHDGGYIYGSWKEPKEFTLRCFYEETAIDRGLMAHVHHVFRVGKSGKLIFKRRPWCYYYATVTDVKTGEMYNYLNGLVTITMKASYPFARCDTMYSLPTDEYHDAVMLNSALFEKPEMVPPTTFENITTTQRFMLGNPGTERAHVAIVAAGDAGTGIIIENKTTNQKCKLVAMSKAITSDDHKRLVVDGINGKTVLYDTVERTSEIAFLYHDYGYIELEPGFPALRNIYANYNNQPQVTFTNIIDQDVIGQYVYLNDKWCKLTEQIDSHTFNLDRSPGIVGYNKTMIMPMNEVEVRAITTMDLTHLSFIYKPTFS